MHTTESIKRLLIKLRHFRDALGLSQLDVAEALKVSLRTYQRIESGESPCDISFLYGFCSKYNIDFNLLTSPVPPKKNPLQIFYSTNEECEAFAEIDAVKKSHLLDMTNSESYTKILESHQPEYKILEEEWFKHSASPLVFSSVSTVVFNAKAQELLNAKTPKTKASRGRDDVNDLARALDALVYYQPRFSTTTFKAIVNKDAPLVITGHYSITNKPTDIYCLGTIVPASNL